MPSILATAAMAALAGSGGRKLDGSAVGPCTHDICGRKLLARASDHGNPTFIETPAQGDSQTFQYTEGAALGANGVFTGYQSTVVNILDSGGDVGKIQVVATMGDDYAHSDRECVLKVTPTILEGEGVSSDITSATFNPSVDPDDPANKYAEVQLQQEDDSYDTSSKTFEVTLDHPQVDGKSLGYLGVELDIKLTCKGDDFVQKDFNLYVSENIDGQGQYYTNQDKVQVRHKFVESGDAPLEFFGGVGEITLSSTYAPESGADLAVQATASAELKTGSDLRFPKGQWDDGVHNFGQAAVGSDTITCSVVKSVKTEFSDLTGWYNPSSAASSGPISYDEGVDDDCNQAGTICTSRKHTKSIVYDTTLGFQIPLGHYYDVAPKIQCVDTAASVTTPEATVDLTLHSTGCGGGQCKLGDIARGLAFPETGSAATTNFGDDLYANGATLGVKDLFTIQKGGPTAWHDLADFYDYTFSVKSTASQCSTIECTGTGVSSDEKTEIASAGSTLQIAKQSTTRVISDLQAALTAKIEAITNTITRPEKYGETRSAYTIANPVDSTTNTLSNNIQIRRDSSNIRVDLTAVDNEGRVTYVQDDKNDIIGFDGPDLAWRDDLGEATLNVAGTSIAESADVRVANVAATGLVFFKEQGDGQGKVSDAVLFDQTIDSSDSQCAKDYCQSPQGGDKWLCSAQSATFSLTVGKESLDSRETDTVVVTKLYSVAADVAVGGGNTPANPSVQPSTTVKYRIAGTSPDAEYKSVAVSDDTGSTNELTFGVISGDARPFDCSAQASQTVSYQAEYRQPCDKVLKMLPYSEPYAMVYSNEQVAPSAAALVTATFSEYELQRVGKDIVFTISPSAVQTYGLPFSDNLRVVAVYKGAALTNDVNCDVDADTGVAQCTLVGFKDASYDENHQLAHDKDCGSDTFACPQLSLKIYEKFAIPEIATEADRPQEGNTEGGKMFYPSSVGSGDKCGTVSAAVEHLISDQQLTIDVQVDGSELTHKAGIQFFNNGRGAPFATVAAQDASDTAASGATSEYATTVSIPRDATSLATAELDDSLEDLKLKLKLDGEGAPRPIQITNLGDGYEVFECNNPSSFAGCINANENNLLDDTIKVVSGSTSSTFTLIVRKLGGGGDPCEDKILGQEAYDGGFKFQITQAADGYTLGNSDTYDFTVHQPHEYTLPLRCHVEQNVKVKQQEVVPSTDAWNDKYLDITLTGSAIDYRKEISISSTGLDGALRLDVGQSDLSAKIARQFDDEDNYVDGALQARLTLDYIDTGDCSAVELDAPLLWASATIYEGADPAKHRLQCPTNALGIKIDGESIADGALLTALSVGDDNFKNFGDVFMIKMAMTGRDSELHNVVPITISADDGSQESIEFLDGSTSQQIKDDGKGVSDVFFRMIGRQETDANDNPLYRIQCSTLTVKLTSKTTTAGDDLDFHFKIKCPRQTSASDASDALTLEYGVQALTFGHAQSTIKITDDPAGAPSASVIHLGSCVEGVATPGHDDGTCELNTGLQTFGGAENPLTATGVLNLFAHCGGSTIWDPVDDGTSITSTAYVARSYQHAKTHFDTAKFCSTTALHITVDKSATKDITIAVAADRNMDFLVHVSKAEWDGDDCADGKYRLITQVDMERQLQNVDTEFKSDGIENFERASNLFKLFYGADGTSQLVNDYDAGQSSLIAKTECKTASDAIHTLSFDMRVALNGVNYYSSASVEMSVSPPDAVKSDEVEYAANIEAFADSLSINTLCDITGNALVTACPKEADGETLSDIPTNENIALTLVIASAEANAFQHEISEPRISFNGKKSDQTTACILYDTCEKIEDLDETIFQASIADGEKADLMSADHKTATLQLSSLGGSENIVIGWTVSRVQPTSGGGRRLRSVERVAYKLGADGSVSKSSTFAVVPAVRDSEGASVVTTKQEIIKTYEDGSTTTYNETIKEHEKSGEDHTLAILGIVFGGLGSVAAIAVAFFVGCASRRDASGVGSSFKTVAGGFSDRQPLFNRNRFAPSDF